MYNFFSILSVGESSILQGTLAGIQKTQHATHTRAHTHTHTHTHTLTAHSNGSRQGLVSEGDAAAQRLGEGALGGGCVCVCECVCVCM